MAQTTQIRSLLALVALALAAALAWLLWSVSGAPGAALEDPVANAVGPGSRTGAGPSAAGGGSASAPREALPGGVPPDSARLHGRVLDAFGEPLGSAWVGEAALDRPTTTLPDGRFELRVPRSGPAVPLLLLAAGHAPQLLTVQIHGDVQDAGDLQMLRGGGLRGRITEAAGQGLAGATVTARFQAGTAWPAALDPDRLFAPRTTSAEGSFSFTHLTPGTWRLSVSAPGRQAGQSAALTVRDGFDTVLEPLALEVGHALSGAVLGPDDRAVAGASVRLRGGSPPRPAGQAETGADGRFRVEGLPPGPLRLEVTRTGFLRFRRDDVDAARGEDLVVRLRSGLRITGTVVDARGGGPVERFAVSVRRTGDLDRPSDGSLTEQLERQILALEASAARATDPEQRAGQERLLAELQSRLTALRAPGPARPVPVPTDLGPPSDYRSGRFTVEGLEEGIYAVGVASPEHQFAQQEAIALRDALPVPALRFALTEGCALAGTVTTRPGRAPVAGALVELVWVLETPRAAAQDPRRSLFPWLFARSAPPGVPLMATRTGADGSFAFRPAAPGRYCLSVRHARIADHETGVLDLAGGRREVRVEVGARASLRGRIGNVTPAHHGNVSVLVLGGHGTLLTVRAAADGTWRHDGLQPGSYLVRAFPTDAREYVNRLFGALFPLHAGAVDPARIPDRDVTLAEGEDRVLDLVLDLPATGSVQGTLAINSRPGRGGLAVLRPVPGEAPGAGGLSLRGACDELGRFSIGDVPAGRYTLLVQGPTRQELHGEPLVVEPGAVRQVQLDLRAGGLRGRVVAADAGAPDELRGYVWVLPGAKDAPADLYEYRRAARAHRIAVRQGVFEDLALTPGPAVVVADLRGRNRTTTQAVIPAGDTLEIELTAGGRQQ